MSHGKFPVIPSRGGFGADDERHQANMRMIERAVSSPWTDAYKEQEQLVNGTTQTNDNKLWFDVMEAGTYVVEFEIGYTGSSTTGDFRWQFLLPTLANGADAQGWYSGINSANASVFSNLIGAVSAWPSAIQVMGVRAVNNIFAFHGEFQFTCTAAGTVRLQFSSAAAADAISKAGSSIRYRRIA